MYKYNCYYLPFIIVNNSTAGLQINCKTHSSVEFTAQLHSVGSKSSPFGILGESKNF